LTVTFKLFFCVVIHNHHKRGGSNLQVATVVVRVFQLCIHRAVVIDLRSPWACLFMIRLQCFTVVIQ